MLDVWSRRNQAIAKSSQAEAKKSKQSLWTSKVVIAVMNAGEPGAARLPTRYKPYLRSGTLAVPDSTQYRILRRNREQEVRNRRVLPANINPDERHQLAPQENHDLGNNQNDPDNNDNAAEGINNGQNAEHGEANILDDRPILNNLVAQGENAGGDEEPYVDFGHDDIERDESLEEPILPNLQRSKFETLLLVLNFAMRHGLSGVAVEDLCKLINCVLGANAIPTSRYLFQKVFSSNLPIEFHMYCVDCLSYITKITDDQRVLKDIPCPVCGKACKVPSRGGSNFFVTLPVKFQIKDLLQNMENVLDHLDYRWQRPKYSDIQDIYDGILYKDLCKEGNILADRYNLSITFSTDGASVFESGCSTLWPIFFRLNELHPLQRFHQSNTMIGALWFGKSEPSMAVFFTSFLRECKDLHNNGFDWRAPNGHIIHSKVVTLNCVLDSVARPMLQSTKLFNGSYGCSYCEHPGVALGDSNTAKYVMDDNISLLTSLNFCYTVTKCEQEAEWNDVTYVVKDRTDADLRRDMVIAENQRRRVAGFKDYRGVKGMSPLYVLPFFDLVSGFSVDYLHACLLGTCKHLACLWFDSSNHRQDFYIRDRLSDIDSRLLTLTPPTSISRRPRSLKERADWKANEWRSWLLYYSLPCLKGILPNSFYKHHCILVSAIYTLLKDSISQFELETATWELGEYVVEFQKLYPPEDMFFNVHLLLHLGRNVSLLGPLWCYSMFSFESGNNCLVKLVKGSSGVLSQIANKYIISRHLPKLVKVYQVSEDVINFCEDLMCYRPNSHASKIGETTLLGVQKIVPLSDEEEEAFYQYARIPTQTMYERFIRAGVVYHARHYSRRGERSDDSIVRLRNDTYAAIIRIILRDNVITLLLRKINVEKAFITCHPCGAKAKHIKVCQPTVYGDLFFGNANEIVGKSMLMKCGRCSYLSDFPNLFEKD